MARMPWRRGPDGRRTRTLALAHTLALAALALLAAAPAPAAAAPRQPRYIEVRLVAPYGSCSAQAMGPATVQRPVMNVPVLLLQRGRIVGRGTTDADGRVRLTPKWPGPVQIRARFETNRVSIHPGAPGRLAYRWESSAFAPPPRGKVRTVSMTGPGPAGLANIWRAMQLAVRAGEAASVVKMPRAKVVWEYHWDLKRRVYELDPTFADSADSVIHISGNDGQFKQRANHRNRTVVRHEWELAPIFHEYAHLLLWRNAWPGDSKDSEHVFTGAYPDDPILPYEEGFANGFASIVMRSAAATLNCRPLWDLTSDHPRPAIKPAHMARYTQFNEIAVAAVVYKLAGLLGNGDRTAGLGKLLTAMRAFEARTGHPPRRMRELHDAILVSGVAVSPGQDAGARLNAVTDIFGSHGMAWGGTAEARFHTVFDDGSYVGTAANNRMGLRLEGPGGVVCDSGADDRDYGPLPGADPMPFSGDLAPGGLPETWIDDCLGRTVVEDGVRIAHPFLSDLSHLRGTWTISAWYACSPGDPPPPDPENPDPHPEAYQCREAISVPATAGRDSIFGDTCGSTWWCGSALGGTPDPGHVTIPRGGSVVLMRFDAYGGCDLHPALLAAGAGYGCHL